MPHRVTRPESLIYNMAQPHTYLQTQSLHAAHQACNEHVPHGRNETPPKAQAGTQNTDKMTRNKVQEEPRRHGHPESLGLKHAPHSHTHTASMSAHKTYRPAAPHGRNETHMTHLLQKNPNQRNNSNLSHPKNTTHAQNMPKKTRHSRKKTQPLSLNSGGEAAPPRWRAHKKEDSLDPLSRASCNTSSV